MLEQPLVSIIIPTYNRAHLIGETLDSVLAQTYQNWECIVVDDGSSDDTDKILAEYCLKDTRFQYVHRPKDRLSGGNAARNYGFELSKGTYIQWFDDDDIMHLEKVEAKVEAFIEFQVDFVVSKSEFFNHKDVFYNYNYTTEDISFNNFAIYNVSWVTDDVMFKRNVVSTVIFNENLKAGQEYNFCCKILLVSENGFFLDKTLTLRRFTENSIGTNRRKNREDYLLSRFNTYWLNYLDVTSLTRHKEFERFSLITCVSCYLRSGNKIKIPSNFQAHLIKVFGFKAVYYFLSRYSNLLFGRYYYFYKKMKKH